FEDQVQHDGTERERAPEGDAAEREGRDDFMSTKPRPTKKIRCVRSTIARINTVTAGIFSVSARMAPCQGVAPIRRATQCTGPGLALLAPAGDRERYAGSVRTDAKG